ncbi:hypothetical protein [Paraburkholderia fynbosensis]|uniref:Uncharacterized protein n=1 Tax=Paraburkholderia fynbosensis TaxID=1200993 RepID=A0A6J5GR98_9BURK|nr:hypothetical protein [Paraburkholderia fynbosensis]CAB3805750.1 hypothetical protein LMG27177_05922 [Paraburkholderia fynbosensis]
MLFTDASNTIYRVDAPFKQGEAYSAAQGQVMQLDVKSGHLTPVVAGIGSASALQDPQAYCSLLYKTARPSPPPFICVSQEEGHRSKANLPPGVFQLRGKRPIQFTTASLH